MIEFLKAYRRYDPASRSYAEILFLYPGVKAIFFHRLANGLARAGVPFFPRLISELSRFLTGIDIHPNARIGRCCIIDHGMGVVIGETAVVGDHVILYQGVTLGGTKLAREKRHPDIGDRVVIGAGAKVLGAITVGSGSRIGANSVVIESVPEDSTVVGIPGRILQHGIREGEELRHDLIR